LTKRLPIVLNYVFYTLRGGFLVRPLLITLLLGMLGATLSILETLFPAISAHAPRLLFPVPYDPQVGQVILSCIATSMMTVVSIVFAILLMTLTLASMQYSPRILVAFARDPVTQQTLGIFLGTFSYCLAALPAARSLPHPTAPALTIVGAMILALACVAWLLFFIQHISQAISVNQIVHNIAVETEQVIDEIMPRPVRRSSIPDPELFAPQAEEAPVLSQVSGYVRFVDSKQLVALAKSYGVRVRVLRRPGHFVPERVALLTVHRAEKLTPALSEALHATFQIGPTRTLQQDIEFGILMIVDIALKAISPAVNDPSTAISCVDQLSRILIRFASREPAQSLTYDPPGIVRVSIPWLGFDRLVEAAFEQIRMYAKSDVAVNLRMLRALNDIASTLPEWQSCQSLVAMGRRIVSGSAEALNESEMVEMRARLVALEKYATWK
jgi:uncharacterized membrane protein